MRSRFPKKEGNNPQSDDIWELHPACLPVGGGRASSAASLNRGIIPQIKEVKCVSFHQGSHPPLHPGERGRAQGIPAEPQHTRVAEKCRPPIRGSLFPPPLGGCERRARRASSSRLRGRRLHAGVFAWLLYEAPTQNTSKLGVCVRVRVCEGVCVAPRAQT